MNNTATAIQLFALFILYLALGLTYVVWGWRGWRGILTNSRSNLPRNLVFIQVVAGGVTICISLLIFFLWERSSSFVIWIIMFMISFCNYFYTFWCISINSNLSVRAWVTTGQGLVVDIAVIYYYLLAILIGIGMPISLIEICKDAGYPLNYFTNDSGRALLLLLLGITVELLISVLLFTSLMIKAFQLKERLRHETSHDE